MRLISLFINLICKFCREQEYYSAYYPCMFVQNNVRIFIKNEVKKLLVMANFKVPEKLSNTCVHLKQPFSSHAFSFTTSMLVSMKNNEKTYANSQRALLKGYISKLQYRLFYSWQKEKKSKIIRKKNLNRLSLYDNFCHFKDEYTICRDVSY